MKKWSNLPLMAILMTGLLLTNCKKKETDPLEPNPGLVDEIGKIDLPPVELVTPAPVNTTESSITASPAVAALGAGLATLQPGEPVPQAIQSAAADVAASLNPAEIEALSSVDASMISSVAAGGELSPALTAIMEKVTSDPKLNVYLPTFTLPTVNGAPISARTGNSALEDFILNFNDVAVSDECLLKANESFDLAKTRLDASKATQLAAITTAYNAAIAPLAANQTSCTSGLDAKYTTLANQGIASTNAALAGIENARATLGEQLYETLKALTNISALGYLSTLNNLKAAENQACIAVTTAATTAAQAARDANTANVEASYQTALSEAAELRAQLLESCHDQGGGN